MTETPLPPNVYCLPQRAFGAIPGAPWVYYIPDGLRKLFETLPTLGDVAQPRQGLATADNFRFLRYWWEGGQTRIAFGCRSRDEARTSGKKWFPIAKGSKTFRWAGSEFEVINWQHDGAELGAFGGAVIRNPDFYFRAGITLSRVGPSGFSARLNLGGCLFDSSNSASFLHSFEEAIALLGVLNSNCAKALLTAMNPTINFQVGDLVNLPIPPFGQDHVAVITHRIVGRTRRRVQANETTFEFIAPWRWNDGLNNLTAAQAHLSALEAQVNDEVYRLYGISDEDRAAIEAELAGEPLTGEDDETEHATRNTSDGEEGDTESVEPPMTEEELAVRWISYAVGIVLGRFVPGGSPSPPAPLPPGGRGAGGEGRPLGSAVYRREDFAVGSLPAPAEFDQLVGPPERFAYVDAEGGRHLFPAEVEATLRDLAIPDGIAVLDDGHERDLPTLVERALQLMLDWETEHATRNTRQVIEIGAGGDLRKFLSRNFFTQYHFRWYRKRPIYWPLQSARRNYGFVLFHESIDKSALYVLQRDYLDHKLNGLRLQIGDLQGQAEPLSGAARRRMERQMDRATQQLDEITEFATTIERVVREGYEPEPDWIDDGVILRLAPLWELIPIWKREPKKYWGRLERGDYDWSHIAMRYWPDRVREACKTNKSFAIAHGHEEWYEGT